MQSLRNLALWGHPSWAPFRAKATCRTFLNHVVGTCLMMNHASRARTLVRIYLDRQHVVAGGPGGCGLLCSEAPGQLGLRSRSPPGATPRAWCKLHMAGGTGLRCAHGGGTGLRHALCTLLGRPAFTTQSGHSGEGAVAACFWDVAALKSGLASVPALRVEGVCGPRLEGRAPLTSGGGEAPLEVQGATCLCSRRSRL